MSEAEILDRLIELLKDEAPEYRRIAVPKDLAGKKMVFRSLCNIRPPKPAGREFLELEDIYLKGELNRKAVTDSEQLEPLWSEQKSVSCDTTPDRNGGASALVLWKGDITTLKVDGIVNAANGGLTGCYVPCHRCIDNAIHSAAGVALRLECSRLMEMENGGQKEPVGRAKITPGYHLPCKYVIHTVGPYISGEVTEADRLALASCYRSCMELAEANGIHSLAFCCISTGEFHFPAEEAAEIAVKTVWKAVSKSHSINTVIFNVFSEKDDTIYDRILKELFILRN